MSDQVHSNVSNVATQVAGVGAPSRSVTAKTVASAIQSVSAQVPKIEESAVSESDIAHAVEKLNAVLKERDISLRFEKNETLNRFIVEVVDQNTGERLIQVPNDEVIHAVENIDRLRGILFSREA
jgi:uncharacterized FlaG/YvyC family protein